MKKISKKKLEQVLTNAMISGQIAEANKKAAFTTPKSGNGSFPWGGRPLE
jgi:hypothetical protein